MTSGLLNYSLCNQERSCVASQNRYAASHTSDNGHAPRAASHRSSKQCKSQRDPKFAENDVPRRERNHSATAVLPPMNPARHLFVERYVDRAEKRDHEQTKFAEAFPQSQSDVAELHRHYFPRQRHPERRTPNHRTTTDRIIERMRVIDQPGIGSKLGESDDKSEKKKSREQYIAPGKHKADEQTIIDKVECQ